MNRLSLGRGMTIFKVESASISNQNTLVLGMGKNGQLMDINGCVFYGI